MQPFYGMSKFQIDCLNNENKDFTFVLLCLKTATTTLTVSEKFIIHDAYLTFRFINIKLQRQNVVRIQLVNASNSCMTMGDSLAKT